MLDLEALLQPAPSDPPSGPNLQYSPDFASLERAVAGKPQRQVGSAVVPAEPPEWRAILEQGRVFLRASKDLRVAVMVVRASLEMHSFAGLAEGLELVRGLVERFWDTVHPLLDAEDGNDPTARISALAALTHRDMLQALRGAPLIVSRQLGPVTLRALEAAAARPATKPEDAKTAASPANAPPTMATLEAAFQEVAVETLAQSCAALAQCVVQARALADSWAERLPTGGPDFTEFRRVLAQAEQAAKSRWGQRQAAAGPAAPAAPAVATPGVTASSPQTVEPPAGLTGEVRSRDDVVRAIDAICAYYGRAEPSSPLPLMLQRCRRLVPMSFTDILKELLPESIANLQKIAGKLEGGPTPKE